MVSSKTQVKISKSVFTYIHHTRSIKIFSLPIKIPSHFLRTMSVHLLIFNLYFSGQNTTRRTKLSESLSRTRVAIIIYISRLYDEHDKWKARCGAEIKKLYPVYTDVFYYILWLPRIGIKEVFRGGFRWAGRRYLYWWEVCLIFSIHFIGEVCSICVLNFFNALCFKFR